MKKKLLSATIAIAMGLYSFPSYAEQRVDINVDTLTTRNFDVDFEYSASSTTLTGLGLTLYFDSSKLKWNSFSYILPQDKTGADSSPSADSGNADGDASTDSKLTIAWVSLSGNWPNESPVKLITANFSFADTYQPAVGDKIAINLTANAAAGQSFVGLPFKIEITDQDDDGIADLFDNCPADKNPNQENQDGDEKGNACDLDDDNDGVVDTEDAFPLDPSETLDTDKDGIGNNTDNDDDGDGLPDVWENQYGLNPLDPTDRELDSDKDGFSNYLEFISDSDPNDAQSKPDAQVVQIQDSKNKIALGKSFSLSAFYSNTQNDETLAGLGLRIHFDSTKLTWNGFENLLTKDLIGQDSASIPDVSDFDNIAETDQYITVAWTSISGAWPAQTLPTKLYDSLFAFKDDSGLQVGDTTTIGFSSNATSNGYLFLGSPYSVAVAPPFTWDIDGDGAVKPLTDGLLVLRYLFGFTGDTLITNAISNDATRTTATQIEAELLAGIESAILDIDGDGNVKPLTDGLLLLRYLFGFTGDTLISNAVGTGASRATASDIETYIKANDP